MGSKYICKLKSKKGTTMVEVIVSVLILAIVVAGVLTTISFSQRTILSGSSEEKAAAEAQKIADILISELNSGADPSAVTVDHVSQVHNEGFPNEAIDKQFTIIPVENRTDNVKGYQIKTAVYYSDSAGRKCVQMTAFAAKGDGAP